jgi:hypothetical protein
MQLGISKAWREKMGRQSFFGRLSSLKGMKMSVKLINPMNETPVSVSAPPARLRSLEGKTVGLLDISKTGGNLFLDRLEQLLREQFHVASVVRTMKPTFAKPAPQVIIEQLRGADAVIEALAD